MALPSKKPDHENWWMVLWSAGLFISEIARRRRRYAGSYDLQMGADNPPSLKPDAGLKVKMSPLIKVMDWLESCTATWEEKKRRENYILEIDIACQVNWRVWEVCGTRNFTGNCMFVMNEEFHSHRSANDSPSQPAAQPPTVKEPGERR